MAKEIYIDENGTENLVSGTINYGSLLPMSPSDPDFVADRITALENNKIESDFIATQEFTIDSLTVSNNTDYYRTIDVSKTGYTPIGIIQSGFLGSYDTRFHFSRLSLTGNTAYVNFRANAESFSTSGFSVKITVLYTKA